VVYDQARRELLAEKKALLEELQRLEKELRSRVIKFHDAFLFQSCDEAEENADALAAILDRHGKASQDEQGGE